jgi:sugar lactone lactonase YvrE
MDCRESAEKEKKAGGKSKSVTKQISLTQTGGELMYATTTVENVSATAPRISGARRAQESSFNYLVTGIRTLVAASAIAFAPAGTALAVSDHALWVANGTDVVEFGNIPDGTHDEKPKLELNSAATFGAPQGVVFDAKNDLWVIDGGNGTTIPPSLQEFTEAQLKDLKKVPLPMPTVQIKSAGFVLPQQAVFDAAGNMWISDSVANRVWVITPAQLAVSNNNLNFTTTIKAITPPFTFNGALGIALHDGNLYVANVNDTTIFEFNANHLPTIGIGIIANLTPDVVLMDDGHGSIQGPWALVFDKAGDLWSSNANAPFTLVKFGPTQITTTGDPTPETTISPFELKVAKNTFDESLAAPNGIAFVKGELAAISANSPFGVATYDRKQQMKGGSVKPDSFLVGAKTTLNMPAGDNFGPDINSK